ncbi:MAG: hypothetical protein HRF49_00905 [bacterium]|jgi:hypothetical protein
MPVTFEPAKNDLGFESYMLNPSNRSLEPMPKKSTFTGITHFALDNRSTRFTQGAAAAKTVIWEWRDDKVDAVKHEFALPNQLGIYGPKRTAYSFMQKSVAISIEAHPTALNQAKSYESNILWIDLAKDEITSHLVFPDSIPAGMTAPMPCLYDKPLLNANPKTKVGNAYVVFPRSDGRGDLFAVNYEAGIGSMPYSKWEQKIGFFELNPETYEAKEAFVKIDGALAAKLTGSSLANIVHNPDSKASYLLFHNRIGNKCCIAELNADLSAKYIDDCFNLPTGLDIASDGALWYFSSRVLKPGQQATLCVMRYDPETGEKRVVFANSLLAGFAVEH